MTAILHILSLEDDPIATELIQATLEAEAIPCRITRVETRDEFETTLARGNFDMILADYSLPSFDGLAALAIARTQYPALPFIFVSGSLGEEIAIESLKQGATDYVLKHRLSRLAPAVRRAVQETVERGERKKAEEALRESETRFRVIVENTFDLICELDSNARYVYCSPNYREVLGYEPEELLGHDVFTLIHPEDRPAILAELGKLSGQIAFRVQHKNGEWHWLESTGKLYTTAEGHPRGVIVSRDITERKRAEQALQEEAHVAAALARVGQELIASFNTPTILERLCQLTTEVLDCDQSVTAFWQPGELGYSIVAHYGLDAEQLEILQTLKTPQPAIEELKTWLQEAEIAEIKTDLSLHPLVDAMFRQIGVSALLLLALRRGKDLIGFQTASYRNRQDFGSARKRIARGIAQLASFALQNARLLEQAESASRLKSDFLATMSHELRTPLNIVIGYTDLLLGGDFGVLSAEQTTALQAIERSGRGLFELVTALLDVSRLEAGRLPMTVTAVDVARLMAEIEAETTKLSEAKPHVTVTWSLAPTIPPLHTDRVKLKIVLKNLIGNALKFTEAGEVTITTRVLNDGVEFSIADTGIGIAPEVQTMMFEMFRQGDSSTTRQYEGAGLGLYIVKRMLELLGGTITVESAVGAGATFRVWTPLKKEKTQR
jgi:PAS domain S-box-containing protein